MERLELLLSNRMTNSRFKVSKGDRTVASPKTLKPQPLLAHSNLFLLIFLVISGFSTLVKSEPESPLNLDFPCKIRQWYNTEVKKCVACTVCGDGEYVKRACHLDRNTFCAPSHELRFHIESLHLTKEQNEDAMDNEEYMLNWQTMLLVIAVLICAMFFVVIGCMLIQHMRQWRRMERQLDRDVEELSTKLMARLAEAQTTNTLRITKDNEEMFLIDNPINSKNFRPVEVKCIYIDRISGTVFRFCFVSRFSYFVIHR
ncbi:wgn family protein [Megaselia abdita]